MLIKWIVCTVPPEQRQAFSHAQEAWSTIATAHGFIGQIGGWNQHHPEEACVLGLWQDMDSYQTFMDQIHDTVTGQNAQEKTYAAIHVALFDKVIDIAGEADSLSEALSKAAVLRVADCTVKLAQQSHFVEMQRQVWNPDMAKAGGLSGGMFNQHTREPNQYLVTTFWRNMQAHQNYVEHHLPALRQKASVAQDLDSITGYLITLEPGWCVLPATGS